MARSYAGSERSGTPRRSLALTTAADALRDEEVGRTRGFIRLGWLLGIGTSAAVFALPGDRRIGLALVAATAVTTLASVGIYYRLRDPTSLRSSLMTALALACTACGLLGLIYAGYLSCAPLMAALGVYFFCRTESLAAALAIYLTTALGHAALAALIMSHQIEDPGFAPLRPGVSFEALLVAQGCIQLAYVLAFWLARMTRAASLRSIEELQRATKMAAEHLAQLDEARDDLDRALKVGGPGQFTGAVVASWELGFVLGRGGMGEVYEATHVDTEATAAVKLLRRELMLDRMHAERFLREVRAASALDSPHVVRVLEASQPDDPIAFLAMERLRGDTLGGMLRGAGTLGQDLVIELVNQLASVLELARASGIVHRDLKPPNIFRSEDGTWKLLDFGVAVLGDSTGTLTQGGAIGTPGYMAPEQAKGEAVDHRADLYAVGAVIYRCLTGRTPFSGPDPASVLYAMVHDMPVRPSALAPVTPDVERFLAIALAKRRSDRFQTAPELAAMLPLAFAGQLPVTVRAAADALARSLPWRPGDASVDARRRRRPRADTGS
jgi:tRNA A-37 threonylcarbamoyl transferase component Bud32